MEIKLLCQNCGAEKEFSAYIDGDGSLVLMADFGPPCECRVLPKPKTDPCEDWHDAPETYRAVRQEWERRKREAGE